MPRTDWKKKFALLETSFDALNTERESYRFTILNQAKELSASKASNEQLRQRNERLGADSLKEYHRAMMLVSEVEKLDGIIKQLQNLPWHYDNINAARILTRIGWVLYRMGIISVQFRSNSVFRRRVLWFPWKLDNVTGTSA